jgi:RNA polymerase sigma-70 factor (ECF subfamily)
MAEQLVDTFSEVSDRYRRELLAHCYRMLGSVHEAEDLVQETFLRAWRSFHGFEGRSSLRTWLYRIATNACLTALESRNRRPLPTGLGYPSTDPTAPLVEQAEVPWLEPVPDALVGMGTNSPAVDPAAIVADRESVRLAFVAALQYLPPRQRAVLVLREVLALPAAEVAEMLDTSTAAVNSSLQRARAQLDQAGLHADEITEPAESNRRELLGRYVQALEDKDISGLVKLFTEDAVWEMPPFIGWYQGPADIGRLVDTQCPAGPGQLRLLPTEANGQPAFAMYILGDDGTWKPFQLQVLTLAKTGIAHVTAFFDLDLFVTFGLPATLPSAPAGAESG